MTVGESNTLNPCAISDGSGASSDCTDDSTREAGPAPQADGLAPIPGCDGYFIARDGTVISFKHRKFARNRPHEVKSFDGKVILCVDGRRVKRGVVKLVREAFGGDR